MAETSTCPTSGQQKNNLRAIMQTTGRTARTRHIPRRDGTRRPNASTPASPRRWRNRCATFCGHSDRQTAHISPAVEIAGRAAAPVAYADIAPQLGCPMNTRNPSNAEGKIFNKMARVPCERAYRGRACHNSKGNCFVIGNDRDSSKYLLFLYNAAELPSHPA